MKLTQTYQKIESSGLKRSQTFSFALTAKTFDMMFNKLYTDKVQAIIRELSSNAYDAHVEAGKTDVPFNVHLPCRLNDSFWIRDFGPGMSEDKIFGLYSMISESDKVLSDEFIGGFGIGSKTPLCYTDSFSIQSYQAGIKKDYVVFKNEAGLPAIAKMGESATDEPDGLKVQFSVDAKDFQEFSSKAVSVYRYFTVIPKISGSSPVIEQQSYISKNELFGVHTGYYSNVILGQVCYPLPGDYRINQKVDVFFGVGELDVTPSRENLELTEKTKKALADRMELVKEKMVEQAIKDINDAPNFWEASQLYKRLANVLSLPKVQWNGLDINYQLPIELMCLKKEGFGKSAKPIWEKATVRMDRGHFVVSNDPVAPTMFVRHMGASYGHFLVTEAEQQKLRDFGVPEQLFSKFTKKKTVKTTTQKVMALKNTGYWNGHQIDKSTCTDFYVRLIRNQPIYKKEISTRELNLVMKHLKADQIIGLRQKVQPGKLMVDIGEYLDKLVVAEKDAIEQYLFQSTAKALKSDYHMTYLFPLVKDMPELQGFMTKYKNVLNAPSIVTDYSWLPHSFVKDIMTNCNTSAFREEWLEIVYQKYPMIQHVSSYDLSESTTMEEIKQYMRQVDLTAANATV